MASATVSNTLKTSKEAVFTMKLSSSCNYCGVCCLLWQLLQCQLIITVTVQCTHYYCEYNVLIYYHDLANVVAKYILKAALCIYMLLIQQATVSVLQHHLSSSTSIITYEEYFVIHLYLELLPKQMLRLLFGPNSTYVKYIYKQTTQVANDCVKQEYQKT